MLLSIILQFSLCISPFSAFSMWPSRKISSLSYHLKPRSLVSGHTPGLHSSGNSLSGAGCKGVEDCAKTPPPAPVPVHSEGSQDTKRPLHHTAKIAKPRKIARSTRSKDCVRRDQNSSPTPKVQEWPTWESIREKFRMSPVGGATPKFIGTSNDWMKAFYPQGVTPQTPTTPTAQQQEAQATSDFGPFTPKKQEVPKKKPTFKVTQPPPLTSNIIAKSSPADAVISRSASSSSSRNSTSGNSGATSSFSQSWVNSHNQIRALYSTGPLIWSPDLAKSAQQVSDTCIFEHGNSGKGENIAAGQQDPKAVVEDWVYGTDECGVYNPAQPVYSHYTQVLWRSTTKVGCSKTVCPTIQGIGPSNGVFWACQYEPRGNTGEYVENVNSKAGQCIKDI